MSVTKFWNATNDKEKKMTKKELESQCLGVITNDMVFDDMCKMCGENLSNSE